MNAAKKKVTISNDDFKNVVLYLLSSVQRPVSDKEIIDAIDALTKIKLDRILYDLREDRLKTIRIEENEKGIKCHRFIGNKSLIPVLNTQIEFQPLSQIIDEEKVKEKTGGITPSSNKANNEIISLFTDNDIILTSQLSDSSIGTGSPLDLLNALENSQLLKKTETEFSDDIVFEKADGVSLEDIKQEINSISSEVEVQTTQAVKTTKTKSTRPDNILANLEEGKDWDKLDKLIFDYLKKNGQTNKTQIGYDLAGVVNKTIGRPRVINRLKALMEHGKIEGLEHKGALMYSLPKKKTKKEQEVLDILSSKESLSIAKLLKNRAYTKANLVTELNISLEQINSLIEPMVKKQLIKVMKSGASAERDTILPLKKLKDMMLPALGGVSKEKKRGRKSALDSLSNDVIEKLDESIYKFLKDNPRTTLSKIGLSLEKEDKYDVGFYGIKNRIIELEFSGKILSEQVKTRTYYFLDDHKDEVSSEQEEVVITKPAKKKARKTTSISEKPVSQPVKEEVEEENVFDNGELAQQLSNIQANIKKGQTNMGEKIGQSFDSIIKYIEFLENENKAYKEKLSHITKFLNP